MKTQNDKPTLELVENMDWIKKHFDHLIEVEAPRVFAIHGTWGSGKTSAMAQFFYALGGENKGWELYSQNDNDHEVYKRVLTNYPDLDHIKPVWFETWTFQHDPNILQALLWEIRNQLSSRVKIYERLKGDLTNAAKSAFESTYKIALQNIDKTIETVSSSWFVSWYQAGKEAFKGQPTPSNKFSEEPDSIVLREMLERAIDGLLGLTQIIAKDLKLQGWVGKEEDTTSKKVVIFIDDLDRCEPGKVFNILEAIKVFLNIKNCVFVLGMDVDIVSTILNNDKAKGKLYLEKICQETWHLPALNLKKRTAYAQKILQASLQDVNPKTKKLIYDEAFCKDLITTMGRALPVYYRSLKIWNNALVMFLNHQPTKDLVKKNEHDATHVKMLCILSYLYAFQHEIYKLVQIYGMNYYRDVLLAVNDLTGDNELEVHPSLKDLDIPFYPKEAATDDSRVSNRAFLPENPHKILKVIDLIKETEDVNQDLLDLLMI